MMQFLKGYGMVKGGWVLAPAKHYGLDGRLRRQHTVTDLSLWFLGGR